MADFEVVGEERLGEGARDLRRVPAELRRAVYAEVRRAPRVITPAIRQEVHVVMPRRYAPVLSGALRVSAALAATGWVAVRITVKALGRRRERDLPAMNYRGILRHPRWGDRRHWYPTRVRPGVVDRPTAASMAEVGDRVEAGIDHVVASFDRG